MIKKIINKIRNNRFKTAILLLLAVLVIFELSNFLINKKLLNYQTYYYSLNLNLTASEHDAREKICLKNNLAYIKEFQRFREVVECCNIEDGKVIGCYEYLN